MQFVEYGGWQKCARLVSGDVEAIITVEVGPRIIRLGFVGERNEFHENPAEMGLTGGETYHSYGGHRLWYAPEDKIETYQPENEPIDAAEEGGWSIFTPKPNRFGMQKQVRVKPDGKGGFLLHHRITNTGTGTSVIAPWGITVMAPGGICLVPQKAHAPFPEVLTPVGSIALWAYTDMADPRLSFGQHLIRVKQDPDLGPTKIGAFVSQGFAGYLNGKSLFVKRFDADPVATYPDRGCNFETFTREDMLEIESLAPLHELGSGQTVSHNEAWKLYREVSLPSGEADAAAELARYADY